jgi:hypothetical protein
LYVGAGFAAGGVAFCAAAVAIDKQTNKWLTLYKGLRRDKLFPIDSDQIGSDQSRAHPAFSFLHTFYPFLIDYLAATR